MMTRTLSKRQMHLPDIILDIPPSYLDLPSSNLTDFPNAIQHHVDSSSLESMLNVALLSSQGWTLDFIGAVQLSSIPPGPTGSGSRNGFAQQPLQHSAASANSAPTLSTSKHPPPPQQEQQQKPVSRGKGSGRTFHPRVKPQNLWHDYSQKLKPATPKTPPQSPVREKLPPVSANSSIKLPPLIPKPKTSTSTSTNIKLSSTSSSSLAIRDHNIGHATPEPESSPAGIVDMHVPRIPTPPMTPIIKTLIPCASSTTTNTTKDNNPPITMTSSSSTSGAVHCVQAQSPPPPNAIARNTSPTLGNNTHSEGVINHSKADPRLRTTVKPASPNSSTNSTKHGTHFVPPTSNHSSTNSANQIRPILPKLLDNGGQFVTPPTSPVVGNLSGIGGGNEVQDSRGFGLMMTSLMVDQRERERVEVNEKVVEARVKEVQGCLEGVDGEQSNSKRMNGYFLYLKHKSEAMLASKSLSKKFSSRRLVSTVALLWNNEVEEVKDLYKQKAAEMNNKSRVSVVTKITDASSNSTGTGESSKSGLKRSRKQASNDTVEEVGIDGNTVIKTHWCFHSSVNKGGCGNIGSEGSVSKKQKKQVKAPVNHVIRRRISTSSDNTTDPIADATTDALTALFNDHNIIGLNSTTRGNDSSVSSLSHSTIPSTSTQIPAISISDIPMTNDFLNWLHLNASTSSTMTFPISTHLHQHTVLASSPSLTTTSLNSNATSPSTSTFLQSGAHELYGVPQPPQPVHNLSNQFSRESHIHAQSFETWLEHVDANNINFTSDVQHQQQHQFIESKPIIDLNAIDASETINTASTKSKGLIPFDVLFQENNGTQESSPGNRQSGATVTVTTPKAHVVPVDVNGVRLEDLIDFSLIEDGGVGGSEDGGFIEDDGLGDFFGGGVDGYGSGW
ncbi:hypothetical protein HDU76_006024 [Blyttiomyces sp. JEL0837]|nr:hypothetical protein HDU76_006024 [Blyttiomyces sp. JEL0837]